MAIDPKKAAAAQQARQLMTALGSMSEMAHRGHEAGGGAGHERLDQRLLAREHGGRPEK